MMVIDNKYEIGDKVFLLTDVDQAERIVTGIYISPNGLTYELSCGNSDSTHYDFEITKKKDVLKSTTN